jgi:hypothetical protein
MLPLMHLKMPLHLPSQGKKTKKVLAASETSKAVPAASNAPEASM